MSQENARTSLIELRILHIAQLFDPLDPSSFPDRDLSPRAEEYIAGWARELSRKRAFKIIVHMPDSVAQIAPRREIEAGIANYFTTQAEVTHRELRELFRLGWRYFAVGLPILLFCIATSQFVRATLGPGAIAEGFGESLIIVGWVANWKPIETFLYEWWPVKRQRDLYRRLGNAKVSVEISASASAPKGGRDD